MKRELVRLASNMDAGEIMGNLEHFMQIYAGEDGEYDPEKDVFNQQHDWQLFYELFLHLYVIYLYLLQQQTKHIKSQIQTTSQLYNIFKPKCLFIVIAATCTPALHA